MTFPRYFNLADLDGSNGFTINGINGDSSFGSSVSSAGDINADGIDDLIIATPNVISNGKKRLGKSHIVFGSKERFHSSLKLSELNSSNGFTINGINEGDSFGTSVSFAGDINADGIDDLVISARGAAPNGKDSAGESYVIFGSKEGFGSSLELSELDGSNGFAINGINQYDVLGDSLSNAGDINADGIDDLVISARGADPNGKDSVGESYIIFGSKEKFRSSLELSELDGSNGFTINGINQYDYLSNSVSSAGDINADGIDDIIIAASGADPNDKLRAGQVYIVFGSKEKFRSSLELSELDGSNGFTINGINSNDYSGFFLSNAGDINADDIDDIVIAAPLADPNGKTSAGESYVLFGRKEGFGSSLELSKLDGSNGFTIRGISAYDRLGMSVSDAGDINADGVEDLIISAHGVSFKEEANVGQSYVIFGVGDNTSPSKFTSIDSISGCLVLFFSAIALPCTLLRIRRR